MIEAIHTFLMHLQIVQIYMHLKSQKYKVMYGRKYMVLIKTTYNQGDQRFWSPYRKEHPFFHYSILSSPNKCHTC